MQYEVPSHWLLVRTTLLRGYTCKRIGLAIIDNCSKKSYLFHKPLLEKPVFTRTFPLVQHSSAKVLYSTVAEHVSWPCRLPSWATHLGCHPRPGTTPTQGHSKHNPLHQFSSRPMLNSAHACGFIKLITVFRTSCLEILVPGWRTIQAPTTSPKVAFWTETTAASRIPSLVRSAFSIWTGKRFYRSHQFISQNQ